jgi:hypothetical protein
MTTQSPTPSRGLVGDLKRAKREGGASLAELREFVAGMRGRSPQEVLGMVSASALIQATVQATLGCIVLIALWTGASYMAKQNEPKKGAKPTAVKTEEKPATPVAPAVAEAKPANKEPDPAAAAKALNIDEVKTADPNVNPLDKDLDKLLDGK